MAWATSSCDDVGDRLLGGDHADRLAGHHRALLDVAVDHRAAQRASPEMLDHELRRFLVQFAGLEVVAGFRLVAQERLGALR